MDQVNLSLRFNVGSCEYSRATSDPFFAVVTLLFPYVDAPTYRKGPEVIGKTEMRERTDGGQFPSTVNWSERFKLPFMFGQQQNFSVIIYSNTVRGRDAKPTRKLIGQCQFEIVSLLRAPGNTIAKTIKSGGIVYASIGGPFKNSSKSLLLKVQGRRLQNVGLISQSDPFFELNTKKGQYWELVYRSDYIKNELYPLWDETEISLEKLCGNNLNHPIKLSIADHSKKGTAKPMGEVKTTVNELIIAAKKQKKLYLDQDKPNFNPGKILVQKAALKEDDEKLSFLDYLSNKCKLQVSIAIDFTASNGDPRQPGTLHYMESETKPELFNEYQKVLSAIGSTLTNYSEYEQRVPVMGFGAKYDGVIQHCFQCGSNPTVNGAEGILGAYNSMFKGPITLSGPTVFTEVIRVSTVRAVNAKVSAEQVGEQVYSMLFILTDGSVADMNRTKKAIVRVSDHPLSIVIIGVGSANFSALEELTEIDGARDIVHFVSWKDYAEVGYDAMISAALEKIPNQFNQYFSKHKIMPLKKEFVHHDDIIVEPARTEIDLNYYLEFRGDKVSVRSGVYRTYNNSCSKCFEKCIKE